MIMWVTWVIRRLCPGKQKQTKKNIPTGHVGDTAFLPGQKTNITTFGALGGLAFDRIRYQIGKLVRKKIV